MQSTSTTTINTTSMKNTFKFQKEAVGLRFNSPHIHSFSICDKFKKDEPGLIDLVSDQPKVFIPTTTSFYHLYYDHFSELLTQYELTPDAKFIIDITGIRQTESLPEYIKMIFKFLNNNNIDYRPIDLSVNNIININNLYHKDVTAESYSINYPAKRLHEFAKRYVVDENNETSKKVYLSRKNFVNRDLSFFLKGRLPYQNDNRIDDEKKIEEYFLSLGFEIVYPDEFKTFEEQMQFFYNVDTVASLTSSGLTNACFMKPGSTVIEICTPLISFSEIGNGVTDSGSKGQEELHHFYNVISTIMDHNHISIQNTNRSAEEVISKIENNTNLKRLLSS
jgi:hypothetical protein